MENQTMKTKEKNAVAVKATKVEIVRETGSIESMLTQTRSGYIHADKKLNDIPTADLVNYAVEKLTAGQSALRQACLFAGAIFKTCTEEKSKMFSEELTLKWGGMSKDIVSIGKAIPRLESLGLSIDKVRDVYGLRDVRKVLLGDDKTQASKAVALLNEGKAPRKVREAVLGSSKGEKEPAPKEEPLWHGANPYLPEKIEDSALVIETQFVRLAERVALMIDHDDRVKLAMQIFAKLKLAGYSMQKVK
jgi:hypothetical protein